MTNSANRAAANGTVKTRETGRFQVVSENFALEITPKIKKGPSELRKSLISLVGGASFELATPAV